MSLIQTTGQLNVSNNYIKNVLDPILPTDGATKHYVDSLITNLNLYSAGSASLVVQGSAPNFIIKGLVAGNNISLSSISTAIIISSSPNINYLY